MAERSDAEILNAMGTDALLWAEEFTRCWARNVGAGGDDMGFLIGWFANAIEAGRAAGRRGARAQMVADFADWAEANP